MWERGRGDWQLPAVFPPLFYFPLFSPITFICLSNLQIQLDLRRDAKSTPKTIGAVMGVSILKLYTRNPSNPHCLYVRDCLLGLITTAQFTDT